MGEHAIWRPRRIYATFLPTHVRLRSSSTARRGCCAFYLAHRLQAAYWKSQCLWAESSWYIDPLIRRLCSIQSQSQKLKETNMPFSVIVEERRSQSASTELVDDALSLAEECGWRYALAYLISERVPSQVIQRLLSGGARIRNTAIPADIAFPSRSYGCSERNS